MSVFRGVFTPLITPIGEDESPDLESLDRLVGFQLENGVSGLWALGTTGEFASFTESERERALTAVVAAARRRVPVIGNVSDASTRQVIRHAQVAKRAGVQAIAATPPYYYPHAQDELLDHYRRIHSAVDLPLFIYNIPQTVRVRVELQTAQTLAEEGTVAGIKDSQNDLEWFRQLTLFVRERGLEFTVLAGTRSLIDAAVMAGADGAVPSIANAFPELCIVAYRSIVQGDLDGAKSAEADIIRIEAQTASLARGSRNAAVIALLKAILCERGVIATPQLTSPLRTPTQEERRDLLAALEALALRPVPSPATA